MIVYRREACMESVQECSGVCVRKRPVLYNRCVILTQQQKDACIDGVKEREKGKRHE